MTKMLPDVYSPFHQLPTEPLDHEQLSREIEEMMVSDGDLVKYIEYYFHFFRSTVDEFFPQFANVLTLYAGAPFHTTIVRMGPNGIIVGHRTSDKELVEVKRFEDFDPPIDPPNVLDLVKRLQVSNCWFDCTPQKYGKEEAKSKAVSDALSGVLELFWRSIPDGEVFESICRQLIEAEGVHLQEIGLIADLGVDAQATVILNEPAGFRRLETWWFEFKHYPNERFSAAKLRDLEKRLPDTIPPHVLCLVTSDNLTSVTNFIASENLRIRIWDRAILDLLVNRHLRILRTYFDAYPNAVEELTRRILDEEEKARHLRANEFEARLSACPTGKKHFAAYEDIGLEMMRFLFSNNLGEPHPQSATSDRKQRRDVLFRNKRVSPFFVRIFHRFGCDSLIVDFKNYDEPVESDVIFDVSKYANAALGQFILVVSRKGRARSAEEAQLRVFRDYKTVVLVIGDADLIEMAQRKERDLNPEDVLEDKLDELLRKF